MTVTFEKPPKSTRKMVQLPKEHYEKMKAYAEHYEISYSQMLCALIDQHDAHHKHELEKTD